MLMPADNVTFVLSPRTPEGTELDFVVEVLHRDKLLAVIYPNVEGGPGFHVVSQHRCTLTVGDAAATAPMLPAYVFRFEPKG
jgi:hypothetical protein